MLRDSDSDFVADGLNVGVREGDGVIVSEGDSCGKHIHHDAIQLHAKPGPDVEQLCILYRSDTVADTEVVMETLVVTLVVTEVDVLGCATTTVN